MDAAYCQALAITCVAIRVRQLWSCSDRQDKTKTTIIKVTNETI